jgi:hypothetical protein
MKKAIMMESKLLLLTLLLFLLKSLAVSKLQSMV